MKTSYGPAVLLIDSAFLMKLAVCRQWDDALGLTESHACSSVRMLRACYGFRRPLFHMVDVLLTPLADTSSQK